MMKNTETGHSWLAFFNKCLHRWCFIIACSFFGVLSHKSKTWMKWTCFILTKKKSNHVSHLLLILILLIYLQHVVAKCKKAFIANVLICLNSTTTCMAVIDRKFWHVLAWLVFPFRGPHCSSPSSQPSLTPGKLQEQNLTTECKHESFSFSNFPIETWHSCQFLRFFKSKKKKEEEANFEKLNPEFACMVFPSSGSRLSCTLSQISERVAAELSQPKVVGTSLNLIIAIHRLWLIKCLWDGEWGRRRGRERDKCHNADALTICSLYSFIMRIPFWLCSMAQGKYYKIHPDSSTPLLIWIVDNASIFSPCSGL